MSEHIGSRVKHLVEKLYKGTKKDFAEELGLKNHTYLHKLFLKDNLNTGMLGKIAGILNIDITEIIDGSLDIVKEPEIIYGNKDLEIKMLRSRISNLEEMNSILKDQVKLYKELETKRKHKA